jgi:hypothetical protein
MVANSNPQTAGSVSQLSIVVELLFKLCCYIPQWGFDNLVAVVTWLESCVDNNDPVSLTHRDDNFDWSLNCF